MVIVRVIKKVVSKKIPHGQDGLSEDEMDHDMAAKKEKRMLA